MAVGGVHRQSLEEGLLSRLGEAGVVGARRSRGLLQSFDHLTDSGITGERGLPGEHHIDEDAKGVDIATGAQGSDRVVDLLRGDVGRGPSGRLGLGGVPGGTE